MCRLGCQRCSGCLKTNQICFSWFLFLYISTFVGILPYFCRNLKHSSFYRLEGDDYDLLNQVQAENDHRLEIARKYLSHMNVTRSSNLKEKNEKNEKIQFSIVLIAVARNRKHENNYKPRYLTQVVAELLRQREELSVNIPILICNVDSHPDDFEEIKALNVLPVRTKYESPQSFENILEKEKEDYLFCLNATRNEFHSNFVLAIEDDAFPLDNFLRVVSGQVVDKVRYRYNPVTDEYDTRRNIGFVKLYHPERLMHFISSDPSRLCELFALSVSSAILISCVHVVVAKRRALSYYTDMQTVFWVYLLFTTVIILSISRPALLELRRRLFPNYVYVRPTPSCCTPAVLFPVENLDKVLTHLQKTFSEKNRGKDTLLEEAMVKYRLHALLVEPNLVKHIGLYTTLREKRLDPRLVI